MPLAISTDIWTLCPERNPTCPERKSEIPSFLQRARRKKPQSEGVGRSAKKQTKTTTTTHEEDRRENHKTKRPSNRCPPPLPFWVRTHRWTQTPRDLVVCWIVESKLVSTFPLWNPPWNHLPSPTTFRISQFRGARPPSSQRCGCRPPFKKPDPPFHGGLGCVWG